jgi:hypothetical protein
MATSVVDICNNALIRIGSKTITSLSDGDKVANACNSIYEQTRDLLLRQHLWNFAITRAQLASESTSPGFEYDYSYPLPADFIRVKSLYESDEAFKIEKSKLLTNESVLKLIYVARIEDVSKFDPLFTEALILSLAVRLSYILIGSNSRESALKDELQKIMFLAKQVDGQEDSAESLQSDLFLRTKWTGAWDPTKVYGY